MTSYPLTNQDRLSAIFYIALVGGPLGAGLKVRTQRKIMSTRDSYTLPLRCLICGLTGTAWWSEKDRPSIYTGIGRTLDHVSEGFRIVPSPNSKGDSQAQCISCAVEA